MVRVFPAGTLQFSVWVNTNCMNCGKYDQDELHEDGCPIDIAITLACVEGGKVSDEIAQRMGYKPGVSIWRCPEKVEVEE